jgi:hypothetical protein
LQLLDENPQRRHGLPALLACNPVPSQGTGPPGKAVDTKNDIDYNPAALDIGALKQLAADDLVAYFYKDREISCNVL